EHARRRKDLRHLEGARDAEPRDLAGRTPSDVAVLEPDRSLVGAQMAGDHVDERGLAGSIGADDPDRLLRRDVEADIARRHHLAERLLHVAYRQDGGNRLCSSRIGIRSNGEPIPSGRNRMVSSSAVPRSICQVPGITSTAMERTSSNRKAPTKAAATEPAPARMVTKTNPPDVVQ